MTKSRKYTQAASGKKQRHHLTRHFVKRWDHRCKRFSLTGWQALLLINSDIMGARVFCSHVTMQSIKREVFVFSHFENKVLIVFDHGKKTACTVLPTGSKVESEKRLIGRLSDVMELAGPE